MADYEIIRSKRKTLALEVKRDGSVIVRAPLKTRINEIDKFVFAHTDWIEKAKAKQLAREQNYIERSPEEIRQAKLQLRETVTPLVSHWADIMDVEPQAVTITSAQTRFGSCSGKNRLSFSYHLIDYPSEAIEYVVVHELAHIKYHNHSRDFYSFIGKFLPDYREREKLLKK